MDHGFLEKLNPGTYKRLHWYALHGPKPRRIDEIPQDEKSLASWRSLPYFDTRRKLFPPYKDHSWAAKNFGTQPQPKFSTGVPQCISKELLEAEPPFSYIHIYRALYACSYYNSAWKMRVAEVSYGLLAQQSGLSFRTIYRAMHFLRKRWYIRLIWRGRPDPENSRYLHSCYELPNNLRHVVSWRINRGRKRKNGGQLP